MRTMKKARRVIVNDEKYEVGPYLKEIEVWPPTPELPFWEMELTYTDKTVEFAATGNITIQYEF